MNFGQAIEAMCKGERVARAGWNGKGMFIFRMPGYPFGVPANDVTQKVLGLQPGDHVRVRPYLAMVDAQGYLVPGWLASQTDMLADDWMIVDLGKQTEPIAFSQRKPDGGRWCEWGKRVCRWGDDSAPSLGLSPKKFTRENIDQYIDYAESEAGPVCCEEWFDEISNYLRTLVDSEKVFLAPGILEATKAESIQLSELKSLENLFCSEVSFSEGDDASLALLGWLRSKNILRPEVIRKLFGDNQDSNKTDLRFRTCDEIDAEFDALYLQQKALVDRIRRMNKAIKEDPSI